MRCGTPLRQMLKMCEILKSVWVLWKMLRQPSVSAGRTRRCRTRKCWHLSLTNSGFRKSLLDWMLRDSEGDALGIEKVEDGDTVSLSESFG
eukprot:1831462-Amphidinium_carterae.1